MAKQRTVRTNKAYTVDNKIEGIVLAFRAGRGLARLGFRYRTELGLIAALFAAYLVLRARLGTDPSAWVLGGSLTVALIVPLSRRLVLGRLVCARTRRQVIEVFTQTRVENVAGKLPAIVRSRVTPAGVRLTVWCRPGHSAELFDARVEELRAGAHCRNVTITRDPNRSHRVAIDVIRRETLAGVLVRSPLLDLADRIDPVGPEVLR